MKRSEIALIVLLSSISVIVAYFVGSMFFGDMSEEVETITYLAPIDSEVKVPNQDFFNAYAYNPTVEIYIGRCGVDEVWNEMTLQCVPKDTQTEDPAPTPDPAPDPDPDPDPDPSE